MPFCRRPVGAVVVTLSLDRLQLFPSNCVCLFRVLCVWKGAATWLLTSYLTCKANRPHVQNLISLATMGCWRGQRKPSRSTQSSVLVTYPVLGVRYRVMVVSQTTVLLGISTFALRKTLGVVWELPQTCLTIDLFSCVV